MSVSAVLQRDVERRSAGRCEYCRMHQSLQAATFHVEHIVPRVRPGPSVSENLAWACPAGNLHKPDRVEAADPQTGATVALFHPHLDRWGDHFQWEDYRIVSPTPVGRATAAALDFNHPRRVQIRRAEQLFGLFPPGPA